MAIAIEQDLAEYAPAYNDLNVVVSSTNVGEIDFKFVFDLYIEGVANYIRFKVAPEPITANNYGIKNFGNMLEAYVEAYILKDNTLLTGGFQFMDKGIKQYHIQYGEEYRLTANDPIVVYPDDLIGTNKYIWNASLPYNEWINYTFGDYNLSAGNGQWLTTQKTFDVGIDNIGYNGVIASVDTNIEYLEVKTYDSSAVLIDTYQIQNLLSTGVTPSKYMSVVTAPKNLNNVSSGLVLGSQPIVDSAVAYYTCQILDAGLSGVSDLLTFNIQEACDYPRRRLHFQNKLGAFNAFNFDLVSKESVNIKKKSYKFNPNRITASGLLSFDESDRTNVNYHIKSSNQIQLNANYITEEQSIWLEELFTSPEIYLEEVTDVAKGTIRLIAISEIQSNTYQIKTDRVDNLYNVDLIITLSNDNYRQRR